MPTTYAHHRFGWQVRNTLTGRPRQIIEAWPELYSIGLHGPDILFYYHVFKLNHVQNTGLRIHGDAGKHFFDFAKEVENTCEDREDREAHLAYIYGYLCHFALDRGCHGYINSYAGERGVSHHMIEAEFDRTLYLMDGKDPLKERRCGHIHVTDENIRIIRDFYPGIIDKELKTSLGNMILATEYVLKSKGDKKRKFILSIFRLSGNRKYGIDGLVMRKEADPRCRESSEHLCELYDLSGHEAVRLINTWEEYPDCPADVSDLYNYNFSSIRRG